MYSRTTDNRRPTLAISSVSSCTLSDTPPTDTVENGLDALAPTARCKTRFDAAVMRIMAAKVPIRTTRMLMEEEKAGKKSRRCFDG
jgi:hypothetical protein